jgi:hypothetical protein
MGVVFGGGYHGGYYPGRCCGYHGGGYHGGNTIINTGDINIGNNVSVGNRNEISNRMGNDNNVRAGDRDNVYNRPENANRNADPKTARSDLKQARPAPDKANNVFADKNGNVARNNNGSWETRDQGSWKSQPSNAARRPTTPQPSNTNRSAPSSFDRGGMDQAYQSRQHGASRAAARPARGGGRRR